MLYGVKSFLVINESYHQWNIREYNLFIHPGLSWRNIYIPIQIFLCYRYSNINLKYHIRFFLFLHSPLPTPCQAICVALGSSVVTVGLDIQEWEHSLETVCACHVITVTHLVLSDPALLPVTARLPTETSWRLSQFCWAGSNLAIGEGHAGTDLASGNATDFQSHRYITSTYKKINFLAENWFFHFHRLRIAF